MDVALATCLHPPEPDPDETPLLEALHAAGVHAEVRAWDDPTVDWSAARLTVIRSTWNYPQNHRAFVRWLAQVDSASHLINPLSAATWNLHKSYLLELARRGVPIPPTELVEKSDPRSLHAVADKRGWTEVVIKPAVSAASYRTIRVQERDFARGNQHLASLLRDGDVLVQPFLPEVEQYGERSCIWVDGELTHAVCKRARWAEQGESVRPARIAPSEEALARAAIRGAPPGILYARVDMVPGPGGAPILLELELIEPSLYFNLGQGALTKFVEALTDRLGPSPTPAA